MANEVLQGAIGGVGAGLTAFSKAKAQQEQLAVQRRAEVRREKTAKQQTLIQGLEAIAKTMAASGQVLDSTTADQLAKDLAANIELDLGGVVGQPKKPKLGSFKDIAGLETIAPESRSQLVQEQFGVDVEFQNKPSSEKSLERIAAETQVRETTKKGVQEQFKAKELSRDNVIIQKNLGQLFGVFGKIPDSVKGPLAGRTSGALEKITQDVPEVAEFEALKELLVSNMSRAFGQTGVLTDRDLELVRNGLPKISDTNEVAERKIANVNELIQSNIILFNEISRGGSPKVGELQIRAARAKNKLGGGAVREVAEGAEVTDVNVGNHLNRLNAIP